MINPSQKHTSKGIVVQVDRLKDNTLRNLVVELESGLKVESVWGLEHKSIKVGERVTCTVGFRITSDGYVLESVRRSKAV